MDLRQEFQDGGTLMQNLQKQITVRRLQMSPLTTAHYSVQLLYCHGLDFLYVFSISVQLLLLAVRLVGSRPFPEARRESWAKASRIAAKLNVHGDTLLKPLRLYFALGFFFLLFDETLDKQTFRFCH